MSDYGDIDDDEENNGFDNVLNNSKAKGLDEVFDPDAEYEGEFGYNLVKALRGRSPGRKLKRTLFKLGLFQVLCGFSLSIIAFEADRNFEATEFINVPTYGASIQDLWYCVSMPSFIFGIVTMMAVRYWPSLVTNRKLLVNIMRCYLLASLLIFMFTIWCICAVMLTFSKIKNWSETAVLASLRPFYVATLIFIYPYVVAQALYGLEISSLNIEIERGGSIAEPNPPPDVMDLSDVTLLQSCLYCFAFPCIFCIQCCDLLAAIRRVYVREFGENAFNKYRTESSKKRQTIEAKATNARKKRSLLRRIGRTVNRWFTRPKPSDVLPAKKKAQEEEPLELHSLQKDREQEERLERERLQREQELQQARNAEKDRLRQLEIDQERQQREEEEAEREREQAERKRLLREQEEADRRAREEAEEFPTTMTVQQFKALWSTLATSGSFQCQLKAPPLIPTLTEHLRKQGFHIVFAASPNGDIEVGVSNIRSKKAEPWFMARFLATTTSFSAVMKSEDSNLVTVYVKKFALAKVLKIDTTKK